MVALGNIAVETIHAWEPPPGSVVTWAPSPASLAKVRAAPISAVPPSYMQAQHLRGFKKHAAHGLHMSRLCIAAWDIPGRCDVRAMSYIVTAHLRRHDTYHSWFECGDLDDDGGAEITRHTVNRPADITLVPTKHGEMSPQQWREFLLSTPSPLQWDCFRFAIIQYADHFTFCVSVDHLHVDAMFMGSIFAEVHMMYEALAKGAAPVALPDAGSYAAFCVRQQIYTSSLTAESPPVRAWLDFASVNQGTMPSFPLPTGDLKPGCAGALMTVPLLDEQQMNRFEDACVSAGARFSGGVFACAALTHYELTGEDTYYAITPHDTRTGPAEYMTTGWFTGMIPITVPVSPAYFGATARAAQVSFDSGAELALVPFDTVLRLAPDELGLHRPNIGFPMLSFLDAGLPPLSAMIDSALLGLNAKVYGDGDYPAQVCMWVNRMKTETSVTIFYPDNPVAHESVTEYVSVLKSVYARAAAGSALGSVA
ncbi:condensation domain-containing protein [Mycolicibacterium stellerae]|uniref:condensation domain-containing protein n=1 Tax=Mycolicibacterium stellerae TaxID=2358193 RepID=UPI0013DE0DCD|nr:condensation domain-containing protein [Mycolicibacterium stellerae]